MRLDSSAVARTWTDPAHGAEHDQSRPVPYAELAERLAASENQAERWVGKDALKDFAKWKARKPRAAKTAKKKVVRRAK